MANVPFSIAVKTIKMTWNVLELRFYFLFLFSYQAPCLDTCPIFKFVVTMHCLCVCMCAQLETLPTVLSCLHPLRSFYSLGQGLWLPVSKSFVVPPVELSINPIASCKTDVLVTEDPGEVRSVTLLTFLFDHHSAHAQAICVFVCFFEPIFWFPAKNR